MKRNSVGSLHGDLPTIAERICKTAHDSMVMVWVSDCAEVYADRDNPSTDMAHCIVGTYSMGMHASDIVEDLQEARRERLNGGLLD